MQWDMLCYGIPAVHFPINLSPARGPHLDVELAIFVGDLLHTSTVFEYFIRWGRGVCCHTSSLCEPDASREMVCGSTGRAYSNGHPRSRGAQPTPLSS